MKPRALEIIEYGLARFIFFIVNLMSRERALKFGSFLGKIIFKIKSLRNTIIDGMTKAFGNEMTPEQINELAKKSAIHWGKSIIEFMLLPKIKKKNMIDDIVDVEPAVKLLNEVLARGNGCIIITGHFGMWEYMCAGTANRGLPVNAIMRPLDNKILDKYVSNIRASFGTKNIPKRHRKQMFKALENNESLIFLIDQNSISKRSVFVPFLGQLASTSTGVCWFLDSFKEKNIPVIAVYSYRNENNIHITYAEEVKVIKTDNYEDFKRKNMANFTRYIEKFIKEHPEQWLWLHPRWKKRPDPEEEKIYNDLAKKDLESLENDLTNS